MSTILLVLLFVLAWVVLILPKQRELKRHNALLATLEEGDEVMSGSGIYGTITEIDGDVVHLEVAPGIELKVARRAVASKVAPVVDDQDLDDEIDETDEVDEIDGSADESDEHEDLGHDDLGHDDLGHDDLGHDDLGHDDPAGSETPNGDTGPPGRV